MNNATLAQRTKRAFSALDHAETKLPVGPSQRGLLLAVVGLMIQHGVSDPSYVDVVTFFAAHDLERLIAEFRAGRTHLLFAPTGLVVQRLATPNEIDALRDGLPDGTATVAFDLAGIARLLRVKLTAAGGQN
ncbi:MAG: hypothetical protein AB7O62_11385 [Pirellulales bacterium]